METKNYLFVILILFASLFVVSGRRSEGRPPGNVLGSSLFPLAAPASEQTERHEFPDLGISARSVLARDLGSGATLYEKDPEVTLPIASLTKLATALVVERLVGLEDVIEIKAEDTKVPPYRAALAVGEHFKVRDLVKAMLISSANDAALALSRHAGAGDTAFFVREMNRQAEALGMIHTAFTNPVGFDDEGHYSSAADLSLLVREFLEHKELLAITGLKQAVITSVPARKKHYVLTTNKLMLEDSAITGLKTGYTEEAKGNLIILSDSYYLIILGSDDREGEAKKIMQWVKEGQWK